MKLKNQLLKQNFIHVLLCLLIVCMSACETRIANSQLTERRFQYLLSTIQSWPDSTDSNTVDWAPYIKTAITFQRSDPESVEAALKGYEKLRDESLDLRSFGDDSKLYILMKVVFDLPEHGSSFNLRSFGGWHKRSADINADGTANISWPLSWENGNPRLLCGRVAYDGASYDVASEYNCLRHKYPFRNLQKWVTR